MSEEKGTVRMNISLPRAMKEEIDKAETVNWSQLAVAAFRTKLTELQSKRKGETLDEIIDRMRAADELDTNKLYLDGKEAGEAWAKGEARPKQLRHLDREYNEETFSGLPDAFGYPGIVYRCINGDFDDRDELDRFWERVLGNGNACNMDDVDFGRGFIEGALEVWESVKYKI